MSPSFSKDEVLPILFYAKKGPLKGIVWIFCANLSSCNMFVDLLIVLLMNSRDFEIAFANTWFY